MLEFLEIEKFSDDVVQYYMINKAPWPLTNRDFVETRYTRYKENGDIEIFYSESESDQYKQPAEKVERAKTIFGGQIFREVELKTGKTLIVTLLSQAEMGGKIPSKVLKETLPLSLLNWYKAIRKELLKNHEENLEEIEKRHEDETF